MVMRQNESIARVVMLLCFGTAILSLAVHWRMTTSVKPDIQAGRYRNNTISQGSVALQLPWMQTNQTTNAYNGAKWLFSQNLDNQKSSNNSQTVKTQVVVDLSDRRVYVYRYSQVIASYPIGVGKKGWETPTGSFQVMHKQHDPAWRHPITGKVFPAGADSPLGERWIGFWTDGKNQIGFHGTPDEDLVGSPVSHGCLRMRNPDVRLFYEQVSLGTLVKVRQ